MGKIRRGNHTPRHVHVYRDGKLIMKWDLDSNVLISGKDNANLRWLIACLQREGRL
ncbi:MAG: hypothetical protein ABR587_06450 [Candidatus Binatia bacterium]